MVGEGELYGLGFRRLNVPPEGRSRGNRVPSSIWSRSAYEPIFQVIDVKSGVQLKNYCRSDTTTVQGYQIRVNVFMTHVTQGYVLILYNHKRSTITIHSFTIEKSTKGTAVSRHLHSRTLLYNGR